MRGMGMEGFVLHPVIVSVPPPPRFFPAFQLPHLLSSLHFLISYPRSTPYSHCRIFYRLNNYRTTSMRLLAAHSPLRVYNIKKNQMSGKEQLFRRVVQPYQPNPSPHQEERHLPGSPAASPTHRGLRDVPLQEMVSAGGPRASWTFALSSLPSFPSPPPPISQRAPR